MRSAPTKSKARPHQHKCAAQKGRKALSAPRAAHKHLLDTDLVIFIFSIHRMLRAHDAIDHHECRANSARRISPIFMFSIGQSMTSAGENTQTQCALWGVESGFLSERIAARDSNCEI
jgi:hypothetical protein